MFLMVVRVGVMQPDYFNGFSVVLEVESEEGGVGTHI